MKIRLDFRVRKTKAKCGFVLAKRKGQRREPKLTPRFPSISLIKWKQVASVTGNLV